MCLAPITIDNPFYYSATDYQHIHVSSSGYTEDGEFVRNYKKLRMSDKFLDKMKFHNTHNSKIQVPCGQCSQCISMRSGFFNQRVQMESLRSHVFFMTLTYNNESLKYTDVLDYHIPYPVYDDIQKMFRRIRKRGYDIRYACVSEYGSKRKRPHFHLLVFFDKSKYSEHPLTLERKFYNIFLSEWKRRVGGTHRKPIFQSLCTYVKKRGKCTFDFHYVEPIPNHDNDVSFYLSKYMLKYDERTQKLLTKIKLDPRLDDEQTRLLTSLIKPRCVLSKDLGSPDITKAGGCGDVMLYIAKCLSQCMDMPTYYDIHTGKSMLLSPYYRKYCMYNQWMEEHYNKTHDFSIGLPTYSPKDDATIMDKRQQTDYNKKRFLSLRKVRTYCNSKY